MKLNRNFYKAGAYHVCRVCNVKLARLVDGQLRPLGSKRHVIFLLSSGSFYRVNLCQSCTEKLDFADPKVVMSIWASDLYRSQEKVEMALHKPLIGFYVIEDKKISSEKLEDLRRSFLNAR